MERPLHAAPVSVSTLYLLGFLGDGDVRDGGAVSASSRLRAEARYAEFLSLPQPTAPRNDERQVGGTARPRTAPSPAATAAHVHRILVRRELPDPAALPTASSVGECCICYARPKEYACVPCFHLCVCAPCGQRVDRCPICRKPSERIQRVYW